MNLSHIESRPSKQHPGCYEILVEFSPDANPNRVCEVIELFKRKAENVMVHDSDSVKAGEHIQLVAYLLSDSVPWFPRSVQDIDQFANRILSYGAELDSDHPVLNCFNLLLFFRDSRMQYTANVASTLRTLRSTIDSALTVSL